MTMTDKAKTAALRGVPKTPRTKGEGETVNISTRLPREQWLAFRSAAASEGASMTAVLCRLVDEYLSKTK